MDTRWKVFLILLFAAFVLIAYALTPWTLGMGDVELRKISLPHSDSVQTDTIAKPAQKPTEVDTTSQRILFFGDSMLEGLQRRFADYAVENGHELDVVLWYSSTTQLWAQTDTLSHFLRRYNPTFVAICLGSNELFVRDLSSCDRYIGTIVSKLGRIPFVWISPPNWKEDTGINDLIAKHVGKERFFDSRSIKLQRGRDHAHPTFAAAEVWMDSVAVWMNSLDTAHPIRMAKPTVKGKANTITLLQPQ